jgi:hypothetical protein
MIPKYLQEKIDQEKDKIVNSSPSGWSEAENWEKGSKWMYERLEHYNPFSLEKIIAYLENTKDEKWCMDVVKTEDGKSCVLGHVFDYGGNWMWGMFENVFANEFMVFPVNDGKHPDYSQITPKERTIAYLKNMRDGKEKTINQLYDEDYKEATKSKPAI